MILQGFTQDGSNIRYLMDNEQQNTQQIIRHASWLLHLKVLTGSEPMLFKPGGYLNTESVPNERALDPFVRDEVLIPTKIQYEQCKL